MNSEQLKKINKKKDHLEKINDILSNENRLRYVLFCSNNAPFNREKAIPISTDIIDSALVIYCKNLEAELKELGYEE